MSRRWAGPLVTTLIVVGVGLILVLNLDLKGSSPTVPAAAPSVPIAPRATVPEAGPPPGFREYPIGERQTRNEMTIAAVWLPPIAMDGMPSSGDVIHLEADIHATEGNRNGFARDEFVPYLKIAYRVVPADGGEPIHKGELIPMVARDGLHYGASLAMPSAGRFRLIYDIQPPSAGGLGRHSDPATGVAPWWEPFQVAFDWNYPGPPQ